MVVYHEEFCADRKKARNFCAGNAFPAQTKLYSLGGGVLPYLTRRDVPLNRVSIYGTNYATGCPFLIELCDRVLQLIRKLFDMVSCGRMPFRVLLWKQWILAKFLCDRVYFWAIFYGTRYRVWRDLPHTPSLPLSSTPPLGSHKSSSES